MCSLFRDRQRTLLGVTTRRPWPPRTAICLECRTALPAQTGCPHGAHKTASLRDAKGREALLTRVWGPRSIRDLLRVPSRTEVASGTQALLVILIGGRFLAAIADAALVVFALGSLTLIYVATRIALRLVEARRRRDHQAHARGATREPRRVRGHGRRGTIRSVAAGGLVGDPLDGRPCVAFGVTLTHGREREVMLRDGATLGFEVELDSGERARIPAGACMIDGGSDEPHRRPADTLERYLRTLAPSREDDLDPFPCDRASTVTLRPGDRIEILSPLVPTANGAPAPASYREPAPTLLVPDVAVRLRALTTRSPASTESRNESSF